MRRLASRPPGHGAQPTFWPQMIFDVHSLFSPLPDVVGSLPALTTGNSRALAGEVPKVELADAAYFSIALPTLLGWRRMGQSQAQTELALGLASRKLLSDGPHVWCFCQFAYNHFVRELEARGRNFDFHSLMTCSPSKLVLLLTMASCWLYWTLFEDFHFRSSSCR